jgi:hypothetical protein
VTKRSLSRRTDAGDNRTLPFAGRTRAVAQREEPHIANNLGLVATHAADAARIADAAVAAWTAIDGALSPIIGARGIAALYKRSLYLALADHPWLAGAYEGDRQPGDFASLRAVLSQQTARNAAAAHDALLQTFEDLLDSLIGKSLTQRLLQTARDQLPSGAAAVQDPSP